MKRAALNRTRAMRKAGLGIATGSILGFGGYVLYKHRIGETVNLGPLEPVHAEITNQWNALFGSFQEPTTEKLLPDRPKGMPADVPVLVLDMEQTIMQSTWDRRHGWRSVKRPGLDKFLETLCQHYEIVLFSPTSFAFASVVVEQLDPKMKYFSHRLFRESTLYKNGAYIKDLSRLNRPLSRTIIVDDEESGFQLQKENGIKVNAFTDINNINDTTLADLSAFLVRLAKLPRSTDLRAELKKYEGKNIIQELHKEAMDAKQENERILNTGLGGAIRRNYVKRPTQIQAPVIKPAGRPVLNQQQQQQQQQPEMSLMDMMKGATEQQNAVPMGATPLAQQQQQQQQLPPGPMIPDIKRGPLPPGARRTVWEWMHDQQKAAAMEQERLFREHQLKLQQQKRSGGATPF